MDRTQIINYLAKRINAKTYLEIGVRNHKMNYDKIDIEHKVGVDPDVELQCDRDPTYKITSDEYFRHNNEKFDLIFIDGLHEADQVERDIINALDRINQDGFILCHDMNPTVYERQLSKHDPNRHAYVIREEQKGNPEYGLWNGDCWKAFVKLRIHREDLDMKTIDTDFGVGIIQKGKQDRLNVKIADLNYKNLEKNRKHWLNLTSIDEFKNIYQ